MSNSFPRDENAPDASGRDADETGRARRRVLIVDDDPVLVDSLRELLHEEGYAVEGFTDARVALARLRAGARPDVVLLDYLMPAMTGEQFIEELDASGLHPRIVLFTAMHESAFQPKSSSIAGVIRKPFDLDPLLETLDRLSSPGEEAA
jgi:two-component system chemotaxis response regulator CheY